MKRLILGAALLAIFAVSVSLTSHGATAQTPPASTATSTTSTSTPSPTATRTPTATPTPSPTPSPTAVPAAAAAAPAAAEDAGPAIFTCYSIELDDNGEIDDEEANDEEEEEDADDEGTELRIVTEQGPERIIVDGLDLVCVSSTITSDDSEAEAPAAEDTRVLACYSIDDGNDIRDSFSFTTEGFGTDDVVLRDTELVCEEASLTLEDDTTVGEATGVAWLCQRLRGGNDTDADITFATLFGTDTGEIDGAVELCALASEFGDPDDEAVEPTEEIAEQEDAEEPITLLACFDLDGADDADVAVTIETLTFGAVNVLVGNAALVCESATVASGAATANGDGDEDEEEDDDAPQRPIVTSTASGLGGSDTEDDFDSEIARLIEQLRDDPSEETIDRLMDLVHDHDADDDESETETLE